MINQPTDQIGMTLAANIEATIGAISADLSRNIQPKRRGIMKLLKLSLLTVAAAALVIGAGTTARARFEISANNVTDGTYTFTATDSNVELDGSWVAFQGDGITDWNLVDSLSGSGSNFPPLSRDNSRVIESYTYPITPPIYGPNAFTFQIGSPKGDSDGYMFSFWGQNNVNNSSSLFGSPPPDPVGTWTWSPTSVSAPDASGTFGLFAGALLALGACRSFLRRRA